MLFRSLPYWNDSRYIHLLKPTIFAIKTKNIVDSISLLEKYEISEFITLNCLRRNTIELENLIEYLIENEIELIIDDKKGGRKLNPILSASNKMLKEKYGIDIKILKEKGRTR